MHAYIINIYLLIFNIANLKYIFLQLFIVKMSKYDSHNN